MFDLNDLYLYAKVVEHGGFAPAGRILGLPKSRLSRRVAKLEERLGVRLIQRSTRQFQVTEVGLEYYRHCLGMLEQAVAAEDAVERNRAEPRGIVRLASSTALLDSRLAPMLASFMAQCPVVELLVKSYNRRVDVIGEGFDLVLSVQHQPLESSELVMRRLAPSRQCLVAAPGLLAEHGRPLSPEGLQVLPSLNWGANVQDASWMLVGPAGAEAAVRHRPRVVSDDLTVLREAALAGVGAVLLPEEAVRDDLAAGRLVHVLDDWAPREGEVVALFPSRRGLMPAVRKLIDYLADAFEQEQQAATPVRAR
ncbi:LysR substrate-binding domain-containing protein [Pseudomonas mosselii]|uniref:LysR substrate-binding domain-containing protein n=1 Tax=Pseudomonas mosselii TaxID=78327 RepID=UPI0007821582|nr:LysR substrate-binding domain-containing protein [Pseudomonas mosselii]ATB64724.1 LysR family transcriptional regulator [Pseudomonas mosselii]MBC3449485.1 LysR family transcriptional regulator [Pseudomonas mosselii]MDH1104166.1 LysR substrate-binding domain-containing protein [Pseudomonas mosselii]MDN4500631.1 LysR substrate-binding domain-containing protein [Pseudomonas mosselii]MEA3237341.1 LysR substrate-binding domain-containing protein [Pseudomonas mosselii]